MLFAVIITDPSSGNSFHEILEDLWICVHSATRVIVISGTHGVQMPFLFNSKVFTSKMFSSSSTPNLANLDFMDLTLCTEALPW